MSHCCYPYYEKIKNKKEISAIFKNGLRCHYKTFSLIIKKNNQNHDRFAVIVTKKSGSAVYRNRLKRISREIYRQTKVKNPPFYDILLIPRYTYSDTFRTLKEKYRQWRKKLK